MDITQTILFLCLIPLAIVIFRIPELGLVLCFIASSLFKGMVQPLLGPIDLTVYLFAVTYSSIFIRCLRSHSFVLPDRKINISIGLLLALLLASLFYSPLPRLGAEMFLRFAFLTVSVMYATFLWCNNNIERIKKTLTIFTWISLGYGAVLLCWILLLQPTDFVNTVRATLQQTPALSVAQILVIGIIIAFLLRDFLYNKYKRIALNVLMLVGIVELVALNSRGPLIAFIMGGVALFILYPRGQRKQLVIPYTIAATTMILAFIFLPQQFTARYALLADPQSSSIAWRLDAWWFVIQHIPDWFFTGAGLCGFQYYYLGPVDAFHAVSYPHNIFLGIFANAGIIALLAFVGFIYILLHGGLKMTRATTVQFQTIGSYALIAITVIVVLMTTYQFSGSIISSRGLWLFAGLLLATKNLWEQEIHTKAGGALPASAMKACILTSVHPPFDTRIFHKEAKSLVQAGYGVTLIAQHDKNEVVDGVKVIALPKAKNRAKRILGTCRVLKLALKQKAQIYHFHDPELLPIGLLLKVLTKSKIVYDVHEDYAQTLLRKSWVPRILRRLVSCFYTGFVKSSNPFINQYIAATPTISLRYSNNKVSVINNYPILKMFKPEYESNFSHATLIYVGILTRARGIGEIVQAMEYLDKRLNLKLTLLGSFEDSAFEGEVKGLRGFELVDFPGQKTTSTAWRIMVEATIGLVCFRPVPEHIYALPNKLFEYMASGLPVVASNFPLWKEIIEGNKCGLTVNPLEPKEIAEAAEYLIDHPREAKEMGENGRKAVLEKYNWENESKKLISIYKDLLK